MLEKSYKMLLAWLLSYLSKKLKFGNDVRLFPCSSDYIASNEGVINKRLIGKDLEGSSCDLILRNYPSICLEKLRKTTKNLS
jgi:hypothetical protein